MLLLLAVVLVVAFVIWLLAEIIPGAPPWIAKVSLIVTVSCLVLAALGLPA